MSCKMCCKGVLAMFDAASMTTGFSPEIIAHTSVQSGCMQVPCMTKHDQCGVAALSWACQQSMSNAAGTSVQSTWYFEAILGCVSLLCLLTTNYSLALCLSAWFKQVPSCAVFAWCA